MASGILATSAPAATTNTTVYTVPANTTTTFNASFCNRGTSVAQVRLAVCAAATPTTAEYLEYEAELSSYGVLERTGIVAQAGKLVVVYSSTADVSVVLHGFEEV